MTTFEKYKLIVELCGESICFPLEQQFGVGSYKELMNGAVSQYSLTEKDMTSHILQLANKMWKHIYELYWNGDLHNLFMLDSIDTACDLIMRLTKGQNENYNRKI